MSLVLGLSEGPTLALPAGDPETEDASPRLLAETRTDLLGTRSALLRRGAGDEFGFATAIDGDLAAVGAPLDDGAGADAGAVYFFERSGGTWLPVQTSRASDAASGDQFGFSLAMDGSVVAVGVPDDDASEGSVRVFRFSGGVWIEEQTLKASNPEAGASFGHAVAVSGDWILVGSPLKHYERGQAYVFRYGGGSWSQDDMMAPSGLEWGDYFGWSVSLDAGVALVGSIWDATQAGLTGSAYVFRYSGVDWPLEQQLIASDGETRDFFGGAVSVKGTVALIGADEITTGRNGSAYVFRYESFGSTWTEEQKLLASDGQANDGFGYSVSVVGSRALIGSPCDDVAAVDAGSVYSFHHDGGSWMEETKLTASDGASGDGLGFPVSFDGAVALAGASLHDPGGCTDAGAAYVFRLATGWSEEQELRGEGCAIAWSVDAAASVDGDCRGVSWPDYDGDGDEDIYLVRAGASPANALLRNDGGTMVRVSDPLLEDAGQGRAATWADVNNDGNLDVYIVNDPEPARLLLGLGGGAFTDATAPPIDVSGLARIGAWGDYDVDGLVDVYVPFGSPPASTNRLFHNEGGGIFSDVSAPPVALDSSSIGASWADYDGDSDPDLFVTDLTGPDHLFRNDDGTFVDVLDPGLTTAGTAGVAWGDYDNDGDLDVYVGCLLGCPNMLLRNEGDGTFADVTEPPLDNARFTRSVTWLDWDNDADLDLCIVGGGVGANRLFDNQGDGTFADTTASPLGDPASTWGCAVGDPDDDGDPDLYLADFFGSSRLLRNMQLTGNHWVKVKLVGTRSNAAAIGARVRVLAGGVWQLREISGGGGMYSQNALTAMFGLGEIDQATIIQVRWPTGVVQDTAFVDVDRTYTFVETDLIGVSGSGGGPAGRRFLSALPNPFLPRTTITYELPVAGPVRLAVYDVAGRLVRLLVNAPWASPDRHAVDWSGVDAGGRPVAPGVYYVRLETGQREVVRRVTRLPW